MVCPWKSIPREKIKTQYCRPDKLQYCIIILFVRGQKLELTVLRYNTVCPACFFLSGLQYCVIIPNVQPVFLSGLQYCVIIPFVRGQKRNTVGQTNVFVRPTVLHLSGLQFCVCLAYSIAFLFSPVVRIFTDKPYFFGNIHMSHTISSVINWIYSGQLISYTVTWNKWRMLLTKIWLILD